MNINYAARTVAAVTAMLLMAGCATNGPSEKVLENRKQLVSKMMAELPPRSQWSEAQTILIDGFGIIAFKDIAASSVPSGNLNTIADMGMALAGSVAPSSASAGASAFAISSGLFLISGNADPAGTTQIAAWVPVESASTPEQAASIAMQELEKARIKTYPGQLSAVKMQTGKYPYAHGFSYASLGDSLADKPIPFTDAVKQNPDFVGQGSSFGPVFIRNDQMVLDADKSNLDLWGSMLSLSKNLPSWFYIYYPGQKLRTGDIPPAVFSQGRPLFFLK